MGKKETKTYSTEAEAPKKSGMWKVEKKKLKPSLGMRVTKSPMPIPTIPPQEMPTGATPFSSDILSKKMIGKIKPSKASSFPFKLKSGNATPFKLMGSSPAKQAVAVSPQDGAMFGRGGVNPNRPKVPQHGHESHIDGGAVGGGGPEAVSSLTPGAEGGGVWNVGTAIGEMEGMDAMGRKEYMGGLDEGQRARVRHQMARNRRQERKNKLFERMKNPLTGISLWSDVRLKEKIQRTGSSPSGIPIYEFNYIGDDNRYSGAMAQDLLKINPDAVSMDTSGYYKVNYNNIDVDMHLI